MMGLISLVPRLSLCVQCNSYDLWTHVRKAEGEPGTFWHMLGIRDIRVDTFFHFSTACYAGDTEFGLGAVKYSMVKSTRERESPLLWSPRMPLLDQQSRPVNHNAVDLNNHCITRMGNEFMTTSCGRYIQCLKLHVTSCQNATVQIQKPDFRQDFQIVGA